MCLSDTIHFVLIQSPFCNLRIGDKRRIISLQDVIENNWDPRWKPQIGFHVYRRWASYQICNITGCACTGSARNVFSYSTGLRSWHASRHVRHPWCMLGSLTSGSFEVDGEENVPRIPSARATHKFAHLARGLWSQYSFIPLQILLFNYKCRTKVLINIFQSVIYISYTRFIVFLLDKSMKCQWNTV